MIAAGLADTGTKLAAMRRCVVACGELASDTRKALESEEKPGWRIAALGCRASAAPTRTPFDCALEA